MPENAQTSPCREEMAAFTPDEIALIVQLKRFFEWARGDAEFRKSADTNSFSTETLARLKKIGVTFDVNELAILWEKPDILKQCTKYGRCLCMDELPGEVVRELEKYPLFHLWLRYTSTYNAADRKARQREMHIPQNPDFDAWRKRRIAAVRNELGFFGHMLDHPILAFELGDGCSVGCWFCAFSTRKLNKNFDFHQNRELFNGIAKECVDLFGSEAAAATLLYYGTEPHDNPNYLDFVKDFAAVTGHAVCTSTAVPTDAPWLRELIAFYRKDGLPWPRLSVLSRKMMYDIHDLYTPDELRDVELLMQMKESQHDKVKGGRLLEKVEGLRAVENGDYLGATVPQGSIACVSGFLINMVHGTIQLVSPCYTGEKWPCGYRVFGHDRFEGVDGFRAAMDRLIGRYMKNDPRSLKRIRFRDDLRYTKTDGGFTLVSPNQAHTFDGLALYGPLGELAAGGDLDYDGLLDGLMNGGADPFTAGAAVKSLYDHGFLDEVDMY